LVKKITPSEYNRLGFCCFGACQKPTKPTKKGLFCGLGAIVYPSQISTNFGQKYPKTNTSVWGFAVLERFKNRQNRHKKGLFWDLGLLII